MILTTQQESAISKLEKFKVGALFMEMGTGKTYSAYNLISQVKCDVILWVTPCRTIENLKVEINKYGGLASLRIVGVESISSSDRLYLELMNLVSNNKVFIVVDESIKIKNVNAKRTKRMIELGKYAEYKLILIMEHLLDTAQIGKLYV